MQGQTMKGPQLRDFFKVRTILLHGMFRLFVEVVSKPGGGRVGTLIRRAKSATNRDLKRILGLVWLLILAGPLAFATANAADAEEATAKEAVPLGQFVTLTSPIDEATLARVTNEAIKLQKLAVQESRPAYLVLQVEPGTSPFHQVYGLAKFLGSSKIPNVTTVAWVPGTVVGHNALVPLACKQIVMHPDAELGDLGRGQPLEPEDQQAVLGIVSKKQNPLVSPAIVSTMFDEQAVLWQVRLNGPNGDEMRFCSEAELQTLRQANVPIADVQQIKNGRGAAVYRGAVARASGFLVNALAENRAAVADLYQLPRESMREQTLAAAGNLKVRMIRVEGVIDVLLQSFVMRQIDRCVAESADMIVFDIDSPGGQALASMELANTIADLTDKKIRTIAYVQETALSGAAMLALACDEVYMQPHAKLGDIAPIEIQEGGAFARVPEKVMSPIKSAMQTLARRKGRSEALLASMVDRTVKVFQATEAQTGRVGFLTADEILASNGAWIQGPQVPETNGELILTVSGERAHELRLVERPVADFDDLKVRLGVDLKQRLVPVERTWIDNLVFILNQDWITVLLLFAGIAALYLELHFFTGLLGIVSVVCFSLFFWSHFLGGTAGWLEVVLFLLGVGCLALEIFVIPGFGVFGLSGILLILASLVMAIQSFGHFDIWTDVTDFSTGLGKVFGVFLGVALLGVLTARFLPSIPGLSGLVLAAPNAADLRLPRFDDRGHSSMEGDWIGRVGTTVTMLRPVGKAKFDEQLVDVQSEGTFIPPETTVEVVQKQGARIIVRVVAS
jgi:membrane-bound serine protease (ClpP class)